MSLELEGGAAEWPDGFPACSEGMRKLLLEREDATSSAKLIAINPTLRAAAETILPKLVEKAAPTDPDWLIQILVRKWEDEVGMAQTGEEMVAMFAPYQAALAEFPAFAIMASLKAWTAKSGIFPKPSDLKPGARAAAEPIITALGRVRRALEIAAAKAAMPTRETKAADKGAIAEMAAAAAAELLSTAQRHRDETPMAKRDDPMSETTKRLIADGLKPPADPEAF